MTDYSLDATFYRTALLLGLVGGDTVHAWTVQAIDRDSHPPPALIELATVPPSDLTEMRHALWPLVVDPEPPDVIGRILRVVHADFESGRRGFEDTLTVLRQMRSMLRLPRPLYADLNAALTAYAAAGGRQETIAEWLRQFAGTRDAR